MCVIKEDALLASRKASSTCKKGMFWNVERPLLYARRACVTSVRDEKYLHKDKCVGAYRCPLVIRLINCNNEGTKIQSEKNSPPYIIRSSPWKKSMSFPSFISGSKLNMR